VQLLDCQRNGPDLPIAECVITYVIVCHPNNLAHTLGFCPKLWTAQQRSQSGRDFTGPRIGQGKAHNVIPLVWSHFSPKVAIIDRHKGRLGPLAQQRWNGLVFDDGM
jgi:hypothetical protein